ncbi:glycerol kinase [Boudabousia tangfeifanii]|uniref:Glycerol kinase n=1 Tax=Boudabousia tangfeifanii TaxID=1912795 RepID=A0A1D9MIZ0_9ACTO|nr:glycerol kinase GlpK [Boudabousia tangfeifanii]AOZ72275.1 glycerol kinase [Boudabousia tangfeifanii]
MEKLVLAIDQGTTSTRAMLFDHDGQVREVAQLEHKQYFPKAGWVEHDATEIWKNTRRVVAQVLSSAEINRHQLAGIGITNQRETVVVWEKGTGKPIHHAIVWQDVRTEQICQELAKDGGKERFQAACGLPLATYFSAPKIKWILDHVEGARERAEAGELLAGTMDTWVLWNLTGGSDGGVHATDVTNASRTMLMDLHTLKWRDDLCEAFDVPRQMLPEIKPSVGLFGHGRKNGLLIDTPITGILGDQQAACFGQACFTPGDVKNTYGTGCFMLLNTGTKPAISENGLLTTLAYQIGDEAPVYALEGSVAVAGSLVQWLRDNLGIISSAAEVEELAKSVDDNGGVYFVPAFSGLFAPHWRPDARGAIVGLTRFNTKAHLARAVEEATAFQSAEVLAAMKQDAEVELTCLQVDGGMTRDNLLMQFQADILGMPVSVPKVAETTALGVAYAAGLGADYWSSLDEISNNWQEGKTWQPQMEREVAARKMRLWAKAVDRTLDWVDEDVLAEG